MKTISVTLVVILSLTACNQRSRHEVKDEKILYFPKSSAVANKTTTFTNLKEIYFLDPSTKLSLSEDKDYTTEIIIGSIAAAVLLGGGAAAILAKKSDMTPKLKNIVDSSSISPTLTKKVTTSLDSLSKTEMPIHKISPEPTEISIRKRDLGFDTDQNLNIKIVKSPEDIAIGEQPVFVAFKGNEIEFRKVFTDGAEISQKALKNGFSVFEVRAKPQMKSISRSAFTSESLLVNSGGGNIYKIELGGETLIFKELKGDVDSIVESLQRNESSYLQMRNSDYLAPPLDLIKDGNGRVIGYTMRYLDEFSSIHALDLKGTQYDISRVIHDITQGMIDIKKSGRIPRPEHGGNIMLSKDMSRAIIIDLDDLPKGNTSTEREVLEQLNIIFLNTGVPRKKLEPFFDISDLGDISLKAQFDSFESLLGTAKLNMTL